MATWPSRPERAHSAFGHAGEVRALLRPPPRFDWLRWKMGTLEERLNFLKAVRAALVRRAPGDARPEEELDYAIRQIVSRTVAPEGVVDLFAAAGLKKPDISIFASIFSDEFLAEVRGMPQHNGSRIASRTSRRRRRSRCSSKPRRCRRCGHRRLDTGRVPGATQAGWEGSSQGWLARGGRGPALNSLHGSSAVRSKCGPVKRH